MIKYIYIHIGVHKTGSTTIQNSLANKQDLLKNHGFLYPIFSAKTSLITNHSVPFVSMFRSHPEAYFDNKINRITTQGEIAYLHQQYEEQLAFQIANFSGDKLILSGEGICTFNVDELTRLKHFISQFTSSDTRTQIVMFCRNPIKRLNSIIVQLIRNKGGTLQSSIEKTPIPKKYYRSRISYLSEVFGKENITIIRFEDAVKHPCGPTGSLLQAIGVEAQVIDQFENIRYNSASTYEALTIFSAIHESCPYVDDLPYSYQSETLDLLTPLPGQKFVLPQKTQKLNWEGSKQDVDWLCETFSIEKYAYEEEEVPAIYTKWGVETINYLHKIIGDLPDLVKKTILDVLLAELKMYKKEFPWDKKKKLFAFVLYYSLYWQLGSRLKKFRYIENKLGFFTTLSYGGNYLINKFIDRILYKKQI